MEQSELFKGVAFEEINMDNYIIQGNTFIPREEFETEEVKIEELENEEVKIEEVQIEEKQEEGFI